jgi:hypothetical protein
MKPETIDQISASLRREAITAAHKTARSTLALRLSAACVVAAFASPALAAFNSGSTGADGALAPTVSSVEIQVPESGVLNYTSVNIPAGTTVRFKRNTLNTPVYILVSGDVNIAGLIDIRGQDAKQSGTSGDGNLADDGIAGLGGPGGYDGGRGGRDDLQQRPEIIRGGGGLGPGGGKGGIEGNDGCLASVGRWLKYSGMSGAYATNGSNAWYVPGPNYYCSGPSVDQAKAYGSPLLQPLIGGSGGGGGRGGQNYAGAGGGGGGGALLLAASGTITIASTGSIDATGGEGGTSSGTNAGGNGAGGSGGAIRLIATRVTGSGSLQAQGGCRSNGTQRRQDCMNTDFNGGYGYAGLGGSWGRIRVEAEQITYSGTSSPAYVADTPGPVFLSSVPAIRIASVAGQNVPAVPTGTADVTLPTNVQNPVTVNVETTNVPPGNTVLVKMIPAYGNTVEVLSPAITGSTASGTASVQLTLPQGPSVLQATTTYTVVVAMGEALSRFAQNERVEKVQLIATMGQGESQAKLITVSGKEYLVPASVLRMVGFTG